MSSNGHANTHTNTILDKAILYSISNRSTRKQEEKHTKLRAWAGDEQHKSRKEDGRKRGRKRQKKAEEDLHIGHGESYGTPSSTT